MFLREKKAQDKRSNCCSEVPEKVAAISRRQLGKQISAFVEGKEIEIIAMELHCHSIG